ncbi:MAG TPA: sulfatase [Thermomicrobiales bacterium]|nr:sulfatase [Thermomicrobiales bacterium]
MNRVISRRALGALFTLGALPRFPGAERWRAATGATRPPNIVLINLDDLDSRSTAFMPNVRTLLVEEGTSFDAFIVPQPGCSPSRASLLRGQYIHNHGVLRSSGDFGGFQRFHDLGCEESTVATWLQTAGYRTALVGKYFNHYPGDQEPTYIPPGWDEWRSPTDGLADANSRGYRNYTLNENGRLVAYGKKPRDYATDVDALQAEAFIARSAAAATPFFLYVAPRAPHKPAQAAKRHKGSFADAELPSPPAFNEADMSDKPAWARAMPPLSAEQVAETDELRRKRIESLLAVDDLVARLIGRLEQAGELARTFLFFTSDNGFQLGEHRLTSGKGAPYEESIRVPLVVRGPGVRRGATESRLVGMADLAPTFADLAGIAPPGFVDGRSIVPLLGEGSGPEAWRTALVSENFRNSDVRRSGDGRPQRAASEEDDDSATMPSWKALRRARDVYVEYETGEREFYDLAEDPDQLDNAAGKADAATIVRLSAHLAALAQTATDACRAAEDAAFDDPATIPPLPTIQGPAMGEAPAFGEEVTLRGSALDAYGVPVPDDRLVWAAWLRTDGEAAELLPPTPGNDVRFALPPSDERAGSAFLDISLTAADGHGNDRTVGLWRRVPPASDLA